MMHPSGLGDGEHAGARRGDPGGRLVEAPERGDDRTSISAVRVPSAGTTTTSNSPDSDSGWSTDRVIDAVVVTRRFGPRMASSIGSIRGSTSPRAPSATRTMSMIDAIAEPKQPSIAISPIRMT
jgi:hypothetical protein